MLKEIILVDKILHEHVFLKCLVLQYKLKKYELLALLEEHILFLFLTHIKKK